MEIDLKGTGIPDSVEGPTPAYESTKGKRRKIAEAEQFKRGDALLPTEYIEELLGNENIQGKVGKVIKKEAEERLAVGRGLITGAPKQLDENKRRQAEIARAREQQRKEELKRVQDKAKKDMHEVVEPAMPLGTPLRKATPAPVSPSTSPTTAVKVPIGPKG